jgi:hypothetical protein
MRSRALPGGIHASRRLPLGSPVTGRIRSPPCLARAATASSEARSSPTRQVPGSPRGCHNHWTGISRIIRVSAPLASLHPKTVCNRFAESIFEPTLERRSLCRTSGPDGESQGRAQARLACGGLEKRECGSAYTSYGRRSTTWRPVERMVEICTRPARTPLRPNKPHIPLRPQSAVETQQRGLCSDSRVKTRWTAPALWYRNEPASQGAHIVDATYITEGIQETVILRESLDIEGEA